MIRPSRIRCRRTWMLGLLLAAVSPSGWSQVPVPDAGAIRQQIEQQRELPLPRPVPPQRLVLPPEIKPEPGATVTVSAFRFAGNSLLGEDQLNAAVSSFVGRRLGFDQLQRAADAVAAAYREAGWIVRVYLPEQDISEGSVTLQVVEARFGGLRFEGEASRRVPAPVIAAYFEARQRVGEPLSARALDRALLLVDDLAGVNVAGTLAPGADDGETVLVLQTSDQPSVFGDVGADNTGSRSVGSSRLTTNLSINSPLGRGDLLGVNLLFTEGSEYARAALSVPFRQDGMRLGANISSLRYKVVDGPGSGGDARIRGGSQGVGLDSTYPLVRSRLHNLYLLANAERKDFETRDAVVRSDYASVSLRAGASGNLFDGLWGGGANSGSLQWVGGRLVDMNAHAQQDTIDRTYHKLIYSLSRQQAVSARHSLLVSLSGQHATRVLDSSERFFVGGAGSVRAYPSSEAGGERGHLLSGQWRWRFTSTVLLTSFADIGRVTSLAARSGGEDGSATLRGAGLSTSLNGPMGSTATITWSRRLGDNPRRTPTGTDGDGTLRKDRFWLTAAVPF
jgi:hemolysin activation/secretion protein